MEIRENIKALLPSRMLGRPVDYRGYPVPWFVTHKDEQGRWEFRVLDPARYVEALNEGVCWICGQKLDRRLAFAVGPMCGINRISAEPPQHLECAIFAVKACPFMLLPRAQRRTANLPDEYRSHSAGLMRNPGVILIWLTTKHEAIRSEGHVLMRMGRPEAVSFWYEGRTATRAEIDESLRTGCPALRNMAEQEGALDAYHKAVEKFERLLPAA